MEMEFGTTLGLPMLCDSGAQVVTAENAAENGTLETTENGARPPTRRPLAVLDSNASTRKPSARKKSRGREDSADSRSTEDSADGDVAAMTELQRRVGRGHAHAQLELAQAYKNGALGLKKSAKRANVFYHRAVSVFHASCHFLSGGAGASASAVRAGLLLGEDGRPRTSRPFLQPRRRPGFYPSFNAHFEVLFSPISG